jgi:hypothetical protein
MPHEQDLFKTLAKASYAFLNPHQFIASDGGLAS